MKIRIPLDNALGCTLAGTALSFDEQQMILDFGLFGFVVLCAKDDGEGQGFIDEPEEFDPMIFEHEFLIEVGIFTLEEWKSLIDRRTALQAEQMEEWERRELARLKAKYEK